MVAVAVDLRRLRPHAPRVLAFVRRSSGGGDETARRWDPSSRARIRLGEDTAVGGGGRRAAPDLVPCCDNPPRKIPYYRLRPIHFGH
jgi:hypothetical protein